jgi:hypothetical protein
MPVQLTYRAALYDALASGATMGLIGLLGVVAREPWLFPSPVSDRRSFCRASRAA